MENLYFILKNGFQEIIYTLYTTDLRALCFCCCNGLQWFVSYWQESMKAANAVTMETWGGGGYKK